MSTATFTGAISTASSNNLTVSGVTGTIVIGQILSGPNVITGTQITGGSGTTWTVTPVYPNAVPAQSMSANSDAITPNKAFIEPTVGGDSGVWGNFLNADLVAIDSAFGGHTNLTDTGSPASVELSGTQLLPPNLILTSTLTANLTYVIPAGIGGQWSFFNNTSGAHTVTVSSGAGGPTITIPQGSRYLIIADGTSNGVVLSNTPTTNVAAGNSGEVQYNASGSFGGASGLLYSSVQACVFNGSISGTTLTVSSVSSGSIAVGQLLTGPSVVAGTTIISGSGTSWQISNSTTSSGTYTTYTVRVTVGGNLVTSFIVASETLSVVGNITSTTGTVTASQLVAGSSSISGSGSSLYGSSSVPALIANGSGYTPSTTVSYASSITLNCALSNVISTLLTGNVSSFSLTNPGIGQTINWFFVQDSTGSRTVTWPSGGGSGSFKWPYGVAGVLSTAPNAVDLLVATYSTASGTSFWYCTLIKGFA